MSRYLGLSLFIFLIHGQAFAQVRREVSILLTSSATVEDSASVKDSSSVKGSAEPAGNQREVVRDRYPDGKIQVER